MPKITPPKVKQKSENIFKREVSFNDKIELIKKVEWGVNIGVIIYKCNICFTLYDK